MTTKTKLNRIIATGLLLSLLGTFALAPAFSGTQKTATNTKIGKINVPINELKLPATQAYGSVKKVVLSSSSSSLVASTSSSLVSFHDNVTSITPVTLATFKKVVKATSSTASSVNSSASNPKGVEVTHGFENVPVVSSSSSSSQTSSNSSVMSSSSSNVEQNFTNYLVCAPIRDLNQFNCYGIVPAGFDMGNIYHIRIAGNTESVDCKYMINGEGQEVRNFGCDNLPVTHNELSGWRTIEISTNNSAFIPSQARVMVQAK